MRAYVQQAKCALLGVTAGWNDCVSVYSMCLFTHCNNLFIIAIISNNHAFYDKWTNQAWSTFHYDSEKDMLMFLEIGFYRKHIWVPINSFSLGKRELHIVSETLSFVTYGQELWVMTKQTRSRGGGNEVPY